MTKKENWLRLLKNDNPGWISEPWEAFKGDTFHNKFIQDPITVTSKGNRRVGEYLDQFGVTWKMAEGHLGGTPIVNSENKAIKDLKRWKEDLLLPPLSGHDWSTAIESSGKIDRSEYLVCSMISSGLFERTHYLMGFEDALVNYMLEQEHMFDLIGEIKKWKIEHLKQVIDNIKPDVILYHDDWGSKDNLFLPPEVWRSLIKPHHQEIVSYVKSRGVIFLHHSDSICEPIVEDMVEMGIDGWQGIIPQNNILEIQNIINGRMALIGGIDAPVIDRPDFDELVIRDEVRRCIDLYVPQGNFIPCIPNIVPIFPDVKKIYEDELQLYGKHFLS